MTSTCLSTKKNRLVKSNLLFLTHKRSIFLLYSLLQSNSLASRLRRCGNCTTDGKTLGDQLALLIGAVGENASIKRAICFKTSNDLQLAGYAHPTSTNVAAVENTTQIGKYGAIVAFRGASVDEELQKHICQHIVGLNPVKIGEEDKDKPMANKDDETCLIHQEYLIDPDRTVGEVLKENNVTIIDYQRYECGEVTKSERLEQVKLSN